MIICRRVSAAALLLAMLLSLLGGCGFGTFEEQSPSTRPSFTFPQTGVTQPLATKPVATQPVATQPSETQPAATQPPETLPPTTPTVPTFSQITDLRDYMNATADSGTLDFSFCYTGSETLTAQQLAQILSCCYIYYNQDGNLYHVTITEYPGDRMVDAWQSSDRSGLNTAEIQTLDYAIDLVRHWTSYTSDPWELELLIHDYLSEHILYMEGNINFSDPNNVPRELSAVGALLDGRANCQGYVDAFYLLGTIAGLWVDRMYVKEPAGYHVVNTVNLDGQWYIVDVTFDDMDDESVLSHYLFNVGKDRIREYSWAPEMEYRPIAWTTDSAFYYARQGTLFYDERSAAAYVARNWNGEDACFRFMIQGQAEDQAANNALYNALTELGIHFSYTYWYYTDGTDIYFTLYLE